MGAIQNDDSAKVEKQPAPETQQAAKSKEFIPKELEIPAEFVNQEGTVVQSGTLKLTMNERTINFLGSIVLSALMAYDSGDYVVDEDDAPADQPPADQPPAEPAAEQG